MDSDNLQARIQHGIAELRGLHARITACRAALEDWHEGAEPRYSLRLEIRWPQHQSLIAGPARASAEQAVEAGFDAAARSLSRHA
jgi:hypothetical protein